MIVGRYPSADNRSNVYSILTAYHNSGNRWDAHQRQKIRRNVDYKLFVVAGGQRFPATIVSGNGDLLLMFLTCTIPGNIPAMPVMPISNVDPQAGQSVSILGYSYTRNGQYGQRSLTLRSVGPERFEVTSPFEEGESGGPIVQNGKIVGLCEGYDVKTRFGFGPSLGAIRLFLSFNPNAIGDGGRQTGQAGMPMHGGVPMPGQLPMSGGSSVSVPPPPAPDDQSVGDAPRYTPQYVPPVHRPGEITPAPVPVDRPRAEPDPISRPIDETPAEPIPGRADRGPGESGGGAGLGPEIATRGPTPGNPVESPTVGERLGQAASTGLTIWNVLAGVGLVTGIGGPVALGMYALGKLAAARRRRRGDDASTPPYQEDQPSPRPAPTAPTARPVPLAPQQANFIAIPTDYRREAVDWALEQHGRRWPAAIPTVDAIKSLINQRLESRGYGRDTLHQ